MDNRAISASIRFTTHGLTKKPETRKIYEAWLDIKRKCYDKSAKEYCRYGAKGRTLDDIWLNDPTAFVEYMLSLPNFSMEMSVDRTDNTLGYTHGNLRWATPKQQAHNRGISVRNTSGVHGVRFRQVGGATFATATWHSLDDGKAKSKTYAVSQYGLLPAFQMACIHRKKMIQELNAQGAGYSDNHGL